MYYKDTSVFKIKKKKKPSSERTDRTGNRTVLYRWTRSSWFTSQALNKEAHKSNI